MIQLITGAPDGQTPSQIRDLDSPAGGGQPRQWRKRTPGHPSSHHDRDQHAQPADTQRPHRLPPLPARVKWFDRAKGFGFANVFGRRDDVFLHIEVVRHSGFADLVQGEAVGMRVVEGRRGLMAAQMFSWDRAAEDSAAAAPLAEPLLPHTYRPETLLGDDLDDLKDELDNDRIDGAKVGGILQKLGTNTTAASTGTAAGAASPKLATLGRLLTAAGNSLAH